MNDVEDRTPKKHLKRENRSHLQKGLFYLELFLPTLVAPEHHDIGFKLWFEEFLTLWDSVTNSPAFENALVWLFAR